MSQSATNDSQSFPDIEFVRSTMNFDVGSASFSKLDEAETKVSSLIIVRISIIII